MLRDVTQRLANRFLRRSKEEAEMAFWRDRAAQEGRLGHEHYERAYTAHFGLDRDFFAGKRVLDVGCGPRGSLEWATMAAERVGVDPLVDRYQDLGIDRHEMRYVAARAEALPLPSERFEVVAVLNALDHVDDVDNSIREITRVAATGATLLLMVETGHEPTTAEPQSLDWRVLEAFVGWEVDWSARNGVREDHNLYASVDDGIPYIAGAGILRARFTRLSSY